MFKITQQGLNSIFGNVLSEQDKILWVSDGIANNIYVDNKIEKILGISCKVMCEDCDAPAKLLADIGPENSVGQVKQKLRDRLNQPPELSYATYCMQTPQGEKIFFQDSIICVIEHARAQKIYYTGMMKIISPNEYEKSLKYSGPLYNPTPFQEIFDTMDEVKIIHPASQAAADTKMHSGHYEILMHDKKIRVTQREAECLACLANGMSSKLIARELQISPRTVEIHLGNIKRKTETNSRIELLSKIQNIANFK